MTSEVYVHECSICHRIYTGYGNNAWPINDGRCCDPCNDLVIGARINQMRTDRVAKLWAPGQNEEGD